MLGPVLRLCQPLPKLLLIPSLQTNLKWLRVSRQSCGHAVALNCINDRRICLVLRGQDLERRDQTDVGGEQLSVRKVRTCAHA